MRGQKASRRYLRTRENLMQRTPVNPWEWSLQYGFNQAEVIEGHSRLLVCSGQTAIDGEGHTQHAGDLRAQIELSVSNLTAVLDEAGMSLANVVRLTIYTTDVDAMIQNFDALVGPFGAVGVKPPQTLLGVNRLAFPELMVELEATAVS